jgi:hypothetical protein
MDRFTKLPREMQVILGGGVLYLIFSFLDWQQVSFLSVTAGRSEWHGVGIIAGLLVIALLVWEALRLMQVKVSLGSMLTEGLVSVSLALLLLLFTVITFFSHNEARHWPAWIGLILSIVIALAALSRARSEGVQMPRTGGAEPSS